MVQNQSHREHLSIFQCEIRAHMTEIEMMMEVRVTFQGTFALCWRFGKDLNKFITFQFNFILKSMYMLRCKLDKAADIKYGYLL